LFGIEDECGEYNQDHEEHHEEQYETVSTFLYRYYKDLHRNPRIRLVRRKGVKIVPLREHCSGTRKRF